MPKLTTQWIRVGDEKTGSLEFKYDINVTKSGTFTTTLPKDVVAKLQSVGIYVQSNRAGTPGFYEANSMDELIKHVRKISEEYVSGEVIEEVMLIRYAIDTAVSYWRSSNGEICSNGSYDQTGETTGGMYDASKMGWKHGTRDSTGGPFEIEVYAELVLKVTTLFKSGRKKVDFKTVMSVPKETPNLHWLWGVRRMNPNGRMKVWEIEATEENAAFFVALLKAMISLSDRMKQFVTPEDIAEIVASKQPLLQ